MTAPDPTTKARDAGPGEAVRLTAAEREFLTMLAQRRGIIFVRGTERDIADGLSHTALIATGGSFSTPAVQITEAGRRALAQEDGRDE